jgi:hypothetical protein
MASQSQIEIEIASYRTQLAELQRQLRLYQEAGETSNASDVQAVIEQVQDQLLDSESKLERLFAARNSTIPGTPFDDEGILNPGWSLTEDNEPVFVGPDFVEPKTQQSANTTRGIKNAQEQATKEDAFNAAQQNDWRVKLSLAPRTTNTPKILYRAEQPGILAPLAATDGIIFPYTPTIQVTYSAGYDTSELVHTNYKFFSYKSSSVDSVTITCDFTAQDTYEANYLLAVIHFLRSLTKMFYGNDENPIRGTPPPLVFLTGLGAFQFSKHPMVISNFTYSLPQDVDYIRATTHTTTPPGATAGLLNSPAKTTDPSTGRLGQNGNRVGPGGVAQSPQFSQYFASGTQVPTYVPTRMSISVVGYPIVTRNDISNNFSLKDYATGRLLRDKGIW